MECPELGVEVALALVRRAHVGEHQSPDVVVPFARTHQSDGWDPESLLNDLPRERHRSRGHAAHVGVVGSGRDPGGRLASALLVHGCDHRHVRQVRAAPEGVVHHDHVAGRNPAEGVDRGTHGRRHGAEVHRHVVPEGDRAHFGVEQRARVVPAFLDVGAERRPPEGRAHLLREGGEEIAEDLQLDRVEFGDRDGLAQRGHLINLQG